MAKISKQAVLDAYSAHYEVSVLKAQKRWDDWYVRLSAPEVYDPDQLPAKFLWDFLALEPEDLELSFKEQERVRAQNLGWEYDESGPTVDPRTKPMPSEL